MLTAKRHGRRRLPSRPRDKPAVPALRDRRPRRELTEAQHRPKGWTITRARRALIVPAHGRSVRLPEGETLDEGERFMTRRLASLILCGGVAGLGTACATKSFVQKQVSATESKLTQQMTATETNLAERAALQETKLRETADRAGESRQAIDVADQRLNGLDLRVGDVSARERVEAVMRYLVQRHGIELRQLRAITMGKVALGAGEKASPEALAKARRVDIRLLAPWSSWEDALSQNDPTAPEETATVIPAQRGPETISALPVPATVRLPELLKTI